MWEVGLESGRVGMDAGGPSFPRVGSGFPRDVPTYRLANSKIY